MHVLKKPINIHLGDNRSVKATKIGNVLSTFNVYGINNKVKMSNVFYAKDMKMNLISVSKLTEKNNMIILKGISAKIKDKNNKLSAIALKENNVYIMKGKLSFSENKFTNKSRHVDIIEKNIKCIILNQEEIKNESDLNDSVCKSAQESEKSENKIESKSPRRST